MGGTIWIAITLSIVGIISAEKCSGFNIEASDRRGSSFGTDGYLRAEEPWDMFKMEKAVNGNSAHISFESCQQPGWYLRHVNGNILLQKMLADDSTRKNDMSFVRQDNALIDYFTSFEAVSKPGYFIAYKNTVDGMKMVLQVKQAIDSWKRHAAWNIIPSNGGDMQRATERAVAVWMFEEEGGSTVFDSAPGTIKHPGTVFGGVTMDQSLGFDSGKKQHVDIPFHKRLNTDEFAVEFGMKLTRSPIGFMSPICNEDVTETGVHGWCFYINNENKPMVKIGAGTMKVDKMTGNETAVVNYLRSDTALIKNKAYRILFDMDSTMTLRLYVNGLQEGKKDLENLWSPNKATPLRFGASLNNNPNGQYFFAGHLEDVALYDRSMEPERVHQHYKRCDYGYTAKADACVDVDECTQNRGGCPKETACKNQLNGFLCTNCPAYTERIGHVCADINECLVNNGACDSLTRCINHHGRKQTCGPCPNGFSGDGWKGCTDIDECLVGNGGCHRLRTCFNTQGSRLCDNCPSGYRNGQSGGECDDVNECLKNNGGCDPLTKCMNKVGTNVCGPCPHGYTGDGRNGCKDDDECKFDNGGCAPEAPCQNTPGGFRCGRCPDGYVGDGYSGCKSKRGLTVLDGDALENQALTTETFAQIIAKETAAKVKGKLEEAASVKREQEQERMQAAKQEKTLQELEDRLVNLEFKRNLFKKYQNTQGVQNQVTNAKKEINDIISNAKSDVNRLYKEHFRRIKEIGAVRKPAQEKV